MVAWQVITAVSWAVVALVVVGGAVVLSVKRPFRTLHLDGFGDRIDTLTREVAGVRDKGDASSSVDTP